MFIRISNRLRFVILTLAVAATCQTHAAQLTKSVYEYFQALEKHFNAADFASASRMLNDECLLVVFDNQGNVRHSTTLTQEDFIKSYQASPASSDNYRYRNQIVGTRQEANFTIVTVEVSERYQMNQEDVLSRSVHDVYLVTTPDGLKASKIIVTVL